MKKNIGLICFAVVISLFGFGGRAEAEEVNASDQCIIYSIEEDQNKIIEYVDEDGNNVTLSVEKAPAFLRVANGTHKISKTITGVVSISYNITVNSNKITGANSLSAKAAYGSIQSKSLSHTSKKATAKVTVKPSTIAVTKTVVAEISNNKIKVS